MLGSRVVHWLVVYMPVNIVSWSVVSLVSQLSGLSLSWLDGLLKTAKLGSGWVVWLTVCIADYSVAQWGCCAMT